MLLFFFLRTFFFLFIFCFLFSFLAFPFPSYILSYSPLILPLHALTLATAV